MMFWNFIFSFLVGDLSPSILHLVVRVAVMALSSPLTLESENNVSVQSSDAWKSSFAKLLFYIPKEAMVGNGEIPLRCVRWSFS